MGGDVPNPTHEQARTQARFDRPAATELEPATDVWRAENYHQQLLVKRGRASWLL